jgi:hypothetical protein
MRVNFFKIKSMAPASTDGQMDQFIKENGLMINKNVRMSKHGVMEANLKAIVM